jgi:outer membrane immunogenic protein
MSMQKCLLGSVSLIALGFIASANAADMRLPAYAPAYSWTGFYAGATAGGVWGTFDPSTSTIADGYLSAANAAAVSATGSQSIKPSSAIGGVELGYNWQYGNIVTGFEIDAQAYRLSGNAITIAPYAAGGGTFSVTTSINSNWLFTARPRIGILANNWLFYATGGLAVTDLSATFLFGDVFGAFENGTFTNTRVGGVVGGGIEAALWDHWSLKAEYLYVGFGTVTVISNNLNLGAFPGQTFTHSFDLKASIARVGLNFRY